MTRQGGHQDAVKSTRTGPSASITSAWKSASVTDGIWVLVVLPLSVLDGAARYQSYP
jgi:hypothetical protein